jgi:hypothetical protein
VCGFRQDISPPRSCGSPPKISKTIPCKVAGSRRHGCALGEYLTRRANQRHSFSIAQSVKRPWPSDSALFSAILGENSYPQLKCIGSPQRTIACALPNRRASDARAEECRHEHRSEPKYGNGDSRTRSNQGCRSPADKALVTSISPRRASTTGLAARSSAVTDFPLISSELKPRHRPGLLFSYYLSDVCCG